MPFPTVYLYSVTNIDINTCKELNMNKKQFDDLTNELLEAEEQFGTDAVSDRFYKVSSASNPEGLFSSVEELRAYSEMKDSKGKQ